MVGERVQKMGAIQSLESLGIDGPRRLNQGRGCDNRRSWVDTHKNPIAVKELTTSRGNTRKTG
jgi:hypothetical protein